MGFGGGADSQSDFIGGKGKKGEERDTLGFLKKSEAEKKKKEE